MTPTLSDIAKATQTSISTVSRVLGGGPNAQRLSRETRERVLAAARDMGYRPNLLARSLRTRKSNTVALLVSDISNAFFARLAWVTEAALYRRGYSLVLCNSGENAEREMEYLNLLPRKGIDGMIVAPVTSDAGVLRSTLPAGMPLVLLDRPLDSVAPAVTTDQVQAADLLCDALDRVGVKTVALIRGPMGVSTHAARARRVSERFDVVFEQEGPAAQGGTSERVSPDLLRGNPDAIVCTNNVLTLGVIEALQGAMSDGAASPGTASSGAASALPIIAMFDELPAAKIMPMPIVCAEQDITGLATACVERLLPMLDGAAGAEAAAGVPTVITLPAKLTTNARFDALPAARAATARVAPMRE